MDNVIADYLLADFGSFVEKCASAGVDAYEFVGKVAQVAVDMSGVPSVPAVPGVPGVPGVTGQSQAGGRSEMPVTRQGKAAKLAAMIKAMAANMAANMAVTRA